MIYITGDTHRDFDRVEHLCEQSGTTKDDILIILGDAGINYSAKKSDDRLKRELSQLPITLFCIHGNHERRPQKMETYKRKNWHGGTVMWEKEFPNLLFAEDGEIYDLDGYKCLVIGGAYSVDKFHRIAQGSKWWSDEQPSPEIKFKTESRLIQENYEVDVVLSHTCPFRYIPIEMFLPQINQSTVDRSTEKWLGEIEKKLVYQKWYCGHWHTNKTVDKMNFLYTNIEKFFPSDAGFFIPENDK